MERFEHEGKKYWEIFGKSLELLPRQYFDFVSAEKYKEFLERYDLRDRKVIAFGAGYPAPKALPERELSPLASELQEILESRGAKIIAVDVAKSPLERQKEIGRESVLGSAFQLPLKNESVDGGVIILNLFNSSFKGESGKEVFISPEECKKILQEAHRVLQKGKFTISNNYGYIFANIDNLIKITGPEDTEIITAEMIKKLAEEVGFRKIENIPLDETRIELANKFIIESFPEALRDRIATEIKGSGALFLEK